MGSNRRRLAGNLPFSWGNWSADYAGYIYLALGDVDRFFECMFMAAKDHTLDTRILMYSPLFAEVRKDPRFEQLLSFEGIAVRSLT